MPHSRRMLPLISLVAASLLMAGCATTASPPPSTPPMTSTSTPTPTPTPTPEAAPAADLPFDGDCAPVLSAVELDGLLGDEWATAKEVGERWGADPRHPTSLFQPLSSIGGMECRWYTTEERDDGVQLIGLMIAPADSVPSSFTEKFSDARCVGNYDGNSCYLARTDGDAWLMATVGNLLQAPPVAMLEGILDAGAAHLRQPLDAASLPRDGWWELPSCEEFAVDLRIEELIGEDYLTGYWEGKESPELMMLREGGVSVRCQWISTTVEGAIYIPSLQLANGAHWQWDDLAAFEDAEPVSVTGAVSAFLVPNAGDPSGENLELFATDGVNVIMADYASSEMALELTERALAALR